MIYWKDSNIAFFHIPRTGGISAKLFFNSLFGYGKIIKTGKLNFHEPLYKKKQLLTSYVFNLVNVITNIRDPFEYLISLYTYSKQTIPEYRMKLFYKKEIVDLILSFNFNEFVEWYINNGLSFKDYLFVDGKLPDNLYIAKLETFSKDMFEKYKGSFGKCNSSDRSNYKFHYTPEMIDKVHKKFRWTFDNYYKNGAASALRV